MTADRRAVPEAPLRVLCVEDEPDMQLMERFALEDLGGFRVRLCGSAEEALRDPPDPPPDLILLDSVLPGMDGEDALRAFRSRPETARTPVIFLTGRAAEGEAERLLGLGARGVIPKPFDPETLAGRVREILEAPR